MKNTPSGTAAGVLSPDAKAKNARRASEAAVVARLSRGSVSLMRGRYITADELERRRKAVLAEIEL